MTDWNLNLKKEVHKANPQGTQSSGECPAIEITWDTLDSREPGKAVSVLINDYGDSVLTHTRARQKQLAGVSTSRRDLLNKLLMNNIEKLAKRLEKGESFTDLL